MGYILYIYKIQICLAQNMIYTASLLGGPMNSRVPYKCIDCDSLKPPFQITFNAQCSELSHVAKYTCCLPEMHSFQVPLCKEHIIFNYFTISTKNSSIILCFCAFLSSTTVMWDMGCVWMKNRFVLMYMNKEQVSTDEYKQETGLYLCV
jgi:hypothetical protein